MFLLGICHPFDTDILNQSQSISINNEKQMDISTSIAVLSNQIDNSLQLVNEISIQSRFIRVENSNKLEC